MRPRLITAFLTTMMLCVGKSHAQLVINELMQSNIDCVMDDLKEYPDSWVELYNATNAEVNLKDYKIGKTSNEDNAWKLPNKVVGAGQHILVYCDTEAMELHTDFRLESGKGMDIYLFKGGTVVDKVTGLAKQPAPNIAYGRETDGSSVWGYQLVPTPQAGNAGKVCGKDHILGEPVFSEKGYVTEKKRSMSLTLALPEGSPEGTVIRYTTDGSEPTLTNGTVYTAPISFKTTKVIRAKLFCEGWLSPRSTTHSYIVHGRKITLPVISICMDQKHLYDKETGIFECNQESTSDNNWRRPLNIEFFFGDNQESDLNQLCETHITGFTSRSLPKKSMAIHTHKRFGKRHFEYEFFPDQKPGITDFKSLVLRNAGQDFNSLYMRDAIIQRTMGRYTDIDWQAWRPAIVYLNGAYHGMLNIRERANGNNIYSNYNGLEDIDLVEGEGIELKEGTLDNFRQFSALYKEKGHTLAEYAEYMDWEEYINLMVMNLYFNNLDFSGNNSVLWRPRADGGKWRWIAKDTDWGLGLRGVSPQYNTIEWIYNPDYDSGKAWANKPERTRLFRHIMEDEDFRKALIERCCIYMGDFLNERGVSDVWEPMYDLIKYEYPFYRESVNTEWWSDYSKELDDTHEWLAKRTSCFYSMLGEWYKLGEPVPLTINKKHPLSDAVTINFNGIDLHYPTFDGMFFANHRIKLKAKPEEGGEEVIGWRVFLMDAKGSVDLREKEGKVCSFNVAPSCKKIAVEAILDDFDTSESLMWNWIRTSDEIVVFNVPQDMSVRLYDTKGQLLFRASATTGTEIHIPVTKGILYILKVGLDTIKLK